MPTNPQAEANAQAILKTAPVVTQPSAASESVMNSWIPPQRVLAAGISGVAAWVILSLLAHYGIDPQPALDSVFAVFGQPAPDAQAALSGIIALAIATYVKPRQAEIIQHSTNQTVQAAMADPLSKVDYVQVPVQPPPGEPATFEPPATKAP
jgi:hypothetical protein